MAGSCLMVLRVAKRGCDRCAVLGHQHDEDHSPDRQQRVADRVGDRVAEAGDLALGAVVDHAERGRRRARAGDSIPAGWRRRSGTGTCRRTSPGSAARVVATMPQRNRPKPSCCRPATNFGPDEMPTTAMNTFRPTEFMNHTVGDGIRPKVGRTERSQPKKRPAIKRAAGGGQRERHAADLVDERAEQGADGDRRADEGHVGDVGLRGPDSRAPWSPRSCPGCVRRG